MLGSILLFPSDHVITSQSHQFLYLPQGKSLTRMGAATWDRGTSCVSQLPRQGVWELSAGILASMTTMMMTRWWQWPRGQHYDSDKPIALTARCVRLKNADSQPMSIWLHGWEGTGKVHSPRGADWRDWWATRSVRSVLALKTPSSEPSAAAGKETRTPCEGRADANSQNSSNRLWRDDVRSVVLPRELEEIGSLTTKDDDMHMTPEPPTLRGPKRDTP